MAEYNKKRLYWIKLSESFMTSDTVDFLMEQKDGANYVVLYQMLCLKTINNNGELTRKLGEVIIPYNVEKIQRDTKWFTMDTIRVALELYKKLGLIYENQNGNLAITDFERLLGSTTVSAEKKQIQLANRQGGKKVEKIPPYIEIDIDKDIDYISKKERKEINILSSECACACESYDDIFESFCVNAELKDKFIEFIKHCNINGHTLTNDKLKNIIVRLDIAYGENNTEKIKSLNNAILGGWFDIKEGK